MKRLIERLLFGLGCLTLSGGFAWAEGEGAVLQVERRHLLGVYEGMGFVQMAGLILLLAAMFAILCFYKRMLAKGKDRMAALHDEDTTITPKEKAGEEGRG